MFIDIAGNLVAHFEPWGEDLETKYLRIDRLEHTTWNYK